MYIKFVFSCYKKYKYKRGVGFVPPVTRKKKHVELFFFATKRSKRRKKSSGELFGCLFFFLNGSMSCMVTIQLSLDGSVGDTHRRQAANPLGVLGPSQLRIGTQKDSDGWTKPGFFISTASRQVCNRRGISCHFTTTHVNHFFDILYEKKKNNRLFVQDFFLVL